MKRIILTVLMSLVFTALYAQTYAYKHVSTIDVNTEVRSAGSGGVIYITFVKNYSVCYKSDKNGNSLETPSIYEGNNGGVLSYGANQQYFRWYYKFSEDLSRMNLCPALGTYRSVYERVDDPTEVSAPDKLY